MRDKGRLLNHSMNMSLEITVTDKIFNVQFITYILRDLQLLFVTVTFLEII